MNETLDVLGAPMHIKSDTSKLAAFLAEQIVPPGYFVPPHRHASDDELLMVIEGELTLINPEGECRIGAGETACFTRGMLHGFRNDGAASARYVTMATPGLQLLEMFRHFDRATRENGAPLAPPQIVAIAGQYGVQFG